MKKIEEQVQQREAAFIAELQNILKANCTNRIKIACLYQAYINCMAKINTIVSEAQL